MWPALGWCDVRICHLDILHARSTYKYICKYLLIVLSATSHAFACVLNSLTVSTRGTRPVLLAYSHDALQCVCMRLFWACAMRTKTLEVGIEAFRTCIEYVLHWGNVNTTCKRQPNVQSSTGEIVKMSKLWPNFAESATTRSLSASFPDVLHEKLAGGRENENVFPNPQSVSRFNFDGLVLTAKTSEISFWQQTENKHLCELTHCSRCVRLQFSLRSNFGNGKCVKCERLGCELNILVWYLKNERQLRIKTEVIWLVNTVKAMCLWLWSNPIVNSSSS